MLSKLQMGKWLIVANCQVSYSFINNPNLKMLWSTIWHLDLEKKKKKKTNPQNQEKILFPE